MRKSGIGAALVMALLLVLALAVGAVAAPPAQGDAVAAGMSLDTIPGVYVSAVYPAADASGLVQVLELYENQNAQVLSFYVGKDAPILEQGTWASADGVNVTLTLTGQGDQVYATPSVVDYTFDAGTLTQGPFVLTKLWEIAPSELEAGTMPKLPDTAPTPDDPSGVYVSAVYPAADASGMLELLALYPNNNAQLISIYVGKDAPVVENGAWALTADGAVELTLTGTVDQTYDQPSVTTYTRGGAALDDGLFVLFRLDEVTPEEMDAMTAAADAGGDDATLGQQLVDGFFAVLQAGDKEQLAALLAPSFQLLRSSGEVFDAASYPASAPVYEAYVLDNLTVTRAGDVLVATYTAQTDATVDGSESLSAAAPRLTVFQQIDGEWKLAAHANFAPPPAAEPAAAPTAEPAAASVTVTENDNDGSIQVAAGSQLVVELPGNPTTGYAWQVTANDESILLPTGYAFTPDSAATGAGGMEKFTFHVMAPGAVSLALANSRPWETDVPPAQTFAVAVEAVAEPAPDLATITVGAADNGGVVTILPGTVLLVSLEGAVDGMWMLTQGDAMIVQPLGDWQALPAADATQATFQRSFLGVGPGQADLQFEFMNADGSMGTDTFALTVDAPAQEPGSSGAVVVTEADAGGESALVTGDTLVVRLAGNPTTGYDWRVVSANDALLPAAGDPTYAVDSDLTGAGGVYTFRFLAKAAGEAAVQIGEFAPGADQPDKTLDFNATIVEPAPLTGNTVAATADDSGNDVAVAAGDWLSIELESNPSTGYLWVVTANDGAVLRLLPESGFTASGDMPGAGGVQRFVFRALQPGAVKLAIGLFPPGSAEPEQAVEYAVTVE